MKVKSLLAALAAGFALLLVLVMIPLLGKHPHDQIGGVTPPASPSHAAEASQQPSVPPVASNRAELDRLSKENALLRGLVTRQSQDQARRDATRESIKDTLASLGVQSGKLDEQLQALGSPVLPLSDEERALLASLPPRVVEPAPAQAASTVAAAETPAADNPPGVNPSSEMAAATPAPAMPRPEISFNPPVAAASVPLARTAKEDFDEGRYAEAGKTYEQLLALEPKNPYLLASQGLVFLRQGNAKAAEAIVRKAATLAPKDAFALATLGIVFFKTQRYDGAIATLTQAIQLDPKNAMAHNYLGITSSQKGWPEAAVDEVQKAVALNPNYAEAHFNLAVIYATSQPPAKDRAEEHYKIATSLGAAPDPALEKLFRN